jgi:hypothetical protein
VVRETLEKRDEKQGDEQKKRRSLFSTRAKQSQCPIFEIEGVGKESDFSVSSSDGFLLLTRNCSVVQTRGRYFSVEKGFEGRSKLEI